MCTDASSEIRVCIVVPCYNEEIRLDVERFRSFRLANSHVEFCFVDDGSTDSTLLLLNALAADHAGIRVVRLDKNCGKAEAVRQGILSLCSDGFTHIGYWDADLATPLDELPKFVNAFSPPNKFKVVMGCRVRRLGSNIQRKWFRHLLGRVFATFVSLGLRLPVYDTQCGAKLISCDLCREIFSEPFIVTWIFDVELLCRVQASEIYSHEPNCILELPLTRWQDEDGSKLKVRDFAKAPWELFRLVRTYRSRLKS